MSEKRDRRKARTRRMLYEALLELLAEKGSSGVSVTDIAERAGVNRGTFYLHYRDVPDMLQTLKDEVFDQLAGLFGQLNLDLAMHYADHGEAHPASVELFRELAPHAEFLKLMLGPGGDLAYVHRLRGLIADRIFQNLTSAIPENMPLPPDYVTAYLTSAHFGVFVHWIESGMDQPPERMARMMLSILNYGPLVTLGIRKRPSAP